MGDYHFIPKEEREIKMRILFIDPPFQRFMKFHRYYYPLGLAYMASMLKTQGHDVLVYDAEHVTDGETLSWLEAAQRYDEYPKAIENDNHPIWLEIQNVIKEFSPDVVGITTLSVKVPSALKVAKICKEYNPEIVIVVGADHPTVFPEQTLENDDIDFVVRGEGEQTIVDLVSALEGKKNIKEVQGISFRDKTTKDYIHNHDRELIDDLDSIPFPAINDLMNFASYRPVDFGAIMASRGCPYPCTFCGVFNIWTRKVRYRSALNVVQEMKWLHDTYGTKYFSFRDASFTLNRVRILELCQEILNANLEVEWECLTRADLLDDELIGEMKKSGCVTIRIGVESGSEKILKTMKKKVNLDDIRNAGNLLNKHKIYWTTYFLFGTPQETRETIWETLEFINELNPPFVTVSRFSPIPGTEMYDELVEANLISPYIDWSMESNQRFTSNYVFAMSEDEFEVAMKEVSAIIDAHNKLQSELQGKKDGRLKE